MELSRVGVRKAIGGRWFAAKVALLPIPSPLKAYVIADLAREFERVDERTGSIRGEMRIRSPRRAWTF